MQYLCTIYAVIRNNKLNEYPATGRHLKSSTANQSVFAGESNCEEVNKGAHMVTEWFRIVIVVVM